MITQRDVTQHKTALPKEVYLLHCDNFMVIHSSDKEIKTVNSTRTLEPWPEPPGLSRSSSRLGLRQSTGLSICIHRLELDTSIQGGQPYTWACKYSDSSREIPGEVVGGENQSRCSRAHFDWPRSLGCGFQNPQMSRKTSGCCSRVSGVMAHYTQPDDQEESLAQLRRKQLVKSHALFLSSSVSQKGKSSFVIRRNNK